MPRLLGVVSSLQASTPAGGPLGELSTSQGPPWHCRRGGLKCALGPAQPRCPPPLVPAPLSGSPCVFKLTVILYSQVPPDEGLSPDTLYSGFFQVLSCSLSNPPVFILNSSGKVPGLAVGGFLEFITLCCELPAEGWGGGQVYFWGGVATLVPSLSSDPSRPSCRARRFHQCLTLGWDCS